MGLKLTSSAFKDSEDIPIKYTADGEDISPPLTWEDVPEKTKSFALINDDPDAVTGNWVHWLIFNIPADQTALQENFPSDIFLKNGAIQGITDFGTHGYGGPAPPSGRHRYFFKLYALDTMLDIGSQKVTREVLEKALKGHVLDAAELMGFYSRER